MKFPDKPIANPKAPLPTPVKPVKDRKSLAIALIVSAVFLLAAAGILVWLLTKNPGTTQAPLPTTDPAKNVKSFTFEAPATLPVNYARRDQNTVEAATTYYFDVDTSCGITTGALKLGVNGLSAKDAVLRSVQAAEALGVKVKKSTDGPKFSVADVDGKTTYDFATIMLEQDVNMSGVTFKSQNSLIAYKQLGQEVGTIGYSCKTEAWDAKTAELEALAKAFTLKTVR